MATPLGKAIEWFSGSFEEQVNQAVTMALADIEDRAIAEQFCIDIQDQNDLQTVINNTVASMEMLSLELAAGEISLIDWQIGMRDAALTSYICAGVMAFGGWANVTDETFALIASFAAANFVYLQNFALQIENDPTLMFTIDGKINGLFISRVGQYGRAGRNIFWEIDRFRKQNEGFTHLRSVRNALDSCDECIAQEAIGIVPIDDSRIIPIGSRTCLRKCLCHFEYFTQAEADRERRIRSGVFAL